MNKEKELLKEKKLYDKKMKKLAKEKKKTKKAHLDILSWMDIKEIDDECIRLQSGNKKKMAKGFVLRPNNILMKDEYELRRNIEGFSKGLDNIIGRVYFKIIKKPIDFTKQISDLSEMSVNERDAGRRRLIRLEIDKLSSTRSVGTEKHFYALVVESEDKIDKPLDHLHSALTVAGLEPKDMNSKDYVNLIGQQFYNDQVNQYALSFLETMEDYIDEQI